jgi:hypothetical protein
VSGCAFGQGVVFGGLWGFGAAMPLSRSDSVSDCLTRLSVCT